MSVSRYFCVTTITTYDIVKHRQNVSFEEIDTEPSKWKNDEFSLLWGIFKEYIKQNIIMTMLSKANSHSVNICKLTQKNHCNVKEDPRRKNDSNFDFSQAA